MARKVNTATTAIAPTSNGRLPKGWRMVRFDEIGQMVNERVDPSDTEAQIYVGLEHLDTDTLKIRRWGAPSDVIGDKLGFQKGDIIFGRRRAYQRKLAVAEFDGICSAHAMVVRAKTDAVDADFLPFLMQSDLFMQRAIDISVGSLSPTINWKTLRIQEFPLPPKDEQRRIANILWAIDEAVEKQMTVIGSAQSVFRALVDHSYRLRAEPIESLADVTTKIVDGVHKTPKYVDAGVPFLVVENLSRGPGIDFSQTRYITRNDHLEFIKRANPERGDVLVSKDGTLGIARLVETDAEFSVFVSVALLKPDSTRIEGAFLRYYIDSSLFKQHVDRRTSGSALKHIHLVDFRSAPIRVPSLDSQRMIVETIRKCEMAIASAYSQRQRSENLKRCLMNELLSAGQRPHVH